MFDLPLPHYSPSSPLPLTSPPCPLPANNVPVACISRASTRRQVWKRLQSSAIRSAAPALPARNMSTWCRGFWWTASSTTATVSGEYCSFCLPLCNIDFYFPQTYEWICGGITTILTMQWKNTSLIGFKWWSLQFLLQKSSWFIYLQSRWPHKSRTQ